VSILLIKFITRQQCQCSFSDHHYIDGPIPTVHFDASRWSRIAMAASCSSAATARIGRATALKLAGEGAHVVVNARSNQQEAEIVAREARDLGVKAIPVLADIGKKAEVEALAARALSEFGLVDILINNAAIRPHKPFTETNAAKSACCVRRHEPAACPASARCKCHSAGVALARYSAAALAGAAASRSTASG
jgi:NAD(P)-dependent dehydrogenase (short-subunit alcohol dehydrogenase family)